MTSNFRFLTQSQGGPKRKEEGKSKNFASEADFVKQSLLLWVQNKTASNSYVNVKVRLVKKSLLLWVQSKTAPNTNVDVKVKLVKQSLMIWLQNKIVSNSYIDVKIDSVKQSRCTLCLALGSRQTASDIHIRIKLKLSYHVL